MATDFQIRPASADDIDEIARTIAANAHDSSLFQQKRDVVKKRVSDFIVARGGGEMLGCAQVREYRPGFVEILAVSIVPAAQGRGIGRALMERAIERAREMDPGLIWLSTEKPDYFSRFGFQPFSKWKLPVSILATKLASVFRQPFGRWAPAIFGRPTFMRLAPRG